MASPATNKETAVVRPLVSSLLARRNLFGFSCGQLRRDGYCLASRPRRLALICRGASAGRCAHDEGVRGDPVVSDRQARSGSMLGQPSSACVTWSGNPRRSRASPSGPCGLSIRPSPSMVREKSGKTSMPSAARLREARTYSRPDFAARRRRWPSRPTRGTASGAWRTAGREAGARGAGGRGAGPSADISLLSRGRGKLGADPVRTLFEHVAGPAGEDGAPRGCPAAGCA